MKSRLAASDALYLRPLLFGLDRTESPFDLVIDIAANNAIKLSERSDGIRNAFLSPIDYARHGGEYRIVPDICIASSNPTNTIQLVFKSHLHNVERVAIDVRFTSEIILAKIILAEKYRNQPAHSQLQFIPMMPDIDAMLAKADAVLIVQDNPRMISRADTVTLDLVEEWNDLTGLPYVHGFWVGREEELSKMEAQALFAAKNNGVLLKSQIAQSVAQKQNLSLSELTGYLSSFSYDFSEKEEESLAEFIHYAYFHGVIGDVPEIIFFDVETSNPSQN
ncbi:MAG: MqnA/MqnD/SBP family protein [Bacteroidota bacterium]|jgi:predicted solute-binding protein